MYMCIYSVCICIMFIHIHIYILSVIAPPSPYIPSAVPPLYHRHFRRNICTIPFSKKDFEALCRTWRARCPPPPLLILSISSLPLSHPPSSSF